MADLTTARLAPLYRLRSESYRLLQSALKEQQEEPASQPPEAIERIRRQHYAFDRRIRQIEATLLASHPQR